MKNQTIATSTGRGSKFRRVDALRRITQRTDGRIHFVAYERGDGQSGHYRIAIAANPPVTLVMDGPTADAFIAGVEAAVTAIGTMPDPAPWVTATADHPVTQLEAHDSPLPTPVITGGDHDPDTGTIVTWDHIPGAAHYTVGLRPVDPVTEPWKTVASTKSTDITLRGLTVGNGYLVRVRAISANLRQATDSALSDAVLLTVPPAAATAIVRT